MKVTTAFATRLKALREEKGLSQDELGKQIGISRGSISFYEKESRTPDIVVLDSISKFFDVSLDYLLGYSDSKTIEGVATEKEIGLSEDSIEILKRYKLRYTPDDMKILNSIIQSQNIMHICVLIDQYVKSITPSTKIQILTSSYIATHLPLYNHTLDELKKYLCEFDVSISDEELKNINNFILSYQSLQEKSITYTGNILKGIPQEEHIAILLDEAIEIFEDLIDDVVISFDKTIDKTFNAIIKKNKEAADNGND